MKNQNSYLLMFVLSIIMLAFINCSKDESTNLNTNNFLADSNNQLRVALLEDYTGVRCKFCPDGHEVAKTVAAANPGKFIIIAVHGGDYGIPAAGWPNFTTPYVSALSSQVNINSWPSGTINRISSSALTVPPNQYNVYSIDRTYWQDATTFVTAQKAPVNIGAKATYVSSTRKLTVKVDLYYTGDQPGTHDINVALLQDKLIGKQINQTGTDLNYVQNNVLRDLITGQWGENISDTGMTKGTKISKTYSYDVPTDYNGTSSDGGGAVVISNLKVVVFVTNGHLNVLNAKSVVIH